MIRIGEHDTRCHGYLAKQVEPPASSTQGSAPALRLRQLHAQLHAHPVIHEKNGPCRPARLLAQKYGPPDEGRIETISAIANPTMKVKKETTTCTRRCVSCMQCIASCWLADSLGATRTQPQTAVGLPASHTHTRVGNLPAVTEQDQDRMS